MKEDLIRDLNTGEWKKTLFCEEILGYESLYESEEKIRLSPIFPYGGFNDPADIDICFKAIFLSAVDDITDWFLNTKQRRLRIPYEASSNIGYVLSDRQGIKRDSNKIVLTLRRDSSVITKYGFFVSAFNVV